MNAPLRPITSKVVFPTFQLPSVRYFQEGETEERIALHKNLTDAVQALALAAVTEALDAGESFDGDPSIRELVADFADVLSDRCPGVSSGWIQAEFKARLQVPAGRKAVG